MFSIELLLKRVLFCSLVIVLGLLGGSGRVCCCGFRSISVWVGSIGRMIRFPNLDATGIFLADSYPILIRSENNEHALESLHIFSDTHRTEKNGFAVVQTSSREVVGRSDDADTAYSFVYTHKPGSSFTVCNECRETVK